MPAEVNGGQTADFLKAIARDVAPVRRGATELDGLWGKGIATKGRVDKRVLDELRHRTNGLKIQIAAIERLAAGELPDG